MPCPLRFTVHHTDADREYSYDRQCCFGRSDKTLVEALAKGWTMVEMKKGWEQVFP